MICGIRKVAALAHQLAAQVRVRRKAVRPCSQNRLLMSRNLPTGTGMERMFLLVSSASRGGSASAFFEIFRLDELVDIAHYRAAQRIDVEHWVENILADVFARRRGPSASGGGRAGRGRIRRDAPSRRDAAAGNCRPACSARRSSSLIRSRFALRRRCRRCAAPSPGAAGAGSCLSYRHFSPRSGRNTDRSWRRSWNDIRWATAVASLTISSAWLT
ncbi:Uncharacterised protein [Klebsiella pneumoniae]|uniref:Uncharacterized protein n=1 Tax=Klebsiella pneumoniae TaxID=573 RepID=A0A377ZHU7_KLEPN|nr:Uncharacterised protein [Klebsiella pneumoniae]